MLNKRLLIIACLLSISACDSAPRELTLATPTEPVDRSIVEEFSALINEQSTMTIELTATPLTEQAALDAVQSGEADVALVSNNLPFRSDIATVMPLYPTILHIGRREGATDLPGDEMLRGATVFAGPEGSASRHIFAGLADRLRLQPSEYSYVESIEDGPDVVIVFSSLAPERVADIGRLRELFPDFEFSSIGTPEDIGSGGIIDGAVLMSPYLQPFVIPVGTYGELSKKPIVTLAVDKVLVTNRDLDSAVVYDLINEILRLRPALSAKRPGLFHQLSGDFDVNRSTFVLHSGTQDFLNRDAPSVYERYSGVAEVVVTLMVAIGSTMFAAYRFYRMRRKNRIDKFYTETIALRRSVTESSGADEIENVLAKVRALQNTAFDLLVDEKLAADESFRIFITLSNDVLRELSDD